MNSFALLSCAKCGEVSQAFHSQGAKHRAEQKPMAEGCTRPSRAMSAQTFSLL